MVMQITAPAEPFTGLSARKLLALANRLEAVRHFPNLLAARREVTNTIDWLRIFAKATKQPGCRLVVPANSRSIPHRVEHFPKFAAEITALAEKYVADAHLEHQIPSAVHNYEATQR